MKIVTAIHLSFGVRKKSWHFDDNFLKNYQKNKYNKKQ